ncbi:glycosyl hydrolase family 18 protein [Tenacibaculum salmonis]|uniref:glycosyl hydrolase family 18 protein n=1 Tax=Tenacibaculum sp. P3-BQ1 TaxID=3232310 RepID=UPI0034DE932E
MFVFVKQFSYSFIKVDTIPVQDVSKVKKKEKKVVKFIKNIFNPSDSVKQARQFVHQHHKILRDKKSPNLLTTIAKNKAIRFNTSQDFKLNYEVFGWYPYWEKDYYKSINFSLLSTVAYFSYEVNPKTGHPITVHDWETTALIDSIRAKKDKKILLTVSNFGIKNNRKFLKNDGAIDILINNLITLLSKRNADGVCIDFEGVSKNEKVHYTNFLISLSNRLKKANKNYKIYITLPSVNWSEALDFKAINQAIDCFVIMGYNYYGKTSKYAGPSAPLKSGKTWEPYNLSTSVDYYLKNDIPNSKIILALPTYGTLWETKSLEIKSKVKKYLGNRTFSYIKNNIENNEAIYIEPVSKSAYSAYSIKNTKNSYRQCWFENDSSFYFKTQFIKEKKLKGLGIWALGYDKGYNDFWEIISKELGKPPKILDSSEGETSSTDKNSVDKTQTSSKKTVSIVSRIVNTLGLKDPNGKINSVEKKLVTVTNYKTILLYIMSFVLFFACVGFLIAILYPNTRNAFFSNNSLMTYYITGILILTVVVFRMQYWINDGIVLLIIGFFLGVYAFYLSSKIIKKKQKNLP